MIDDFLVLPEIMVFISLLSAVLYLLKYRRTKNYMELGMSIPRFIMAGIYIWFALCPELPISVTRLAGRDGILLLFLTDVLYNIMYLLAGRKKKIHADHT